MAHGDQGSDDVKSLLLLTILLAVLLFVELDPRSERAREYAMAYWALCGILLAAAMLTWLWERNISI